MRRQREGERDALRRVDLTDEADRPAWGNRGGRLIKAYEEFHGEITRRGLQSGEPLVRV